MLTGFLIFVGLFVVGALGMLAFDISRYALAQNELRNCVDAAALTGAATLSLNNDPTQTLAAQQSAINTATKLFRKNYVLGQSLSSAVLTSSLPLKPTRNQSLLYFDFMIPAPEGGTAQVTAMGNPDGKIIRVRGAFGVVPVFGGFLPIATVPVYNTAISAIPMIDVVDCFDVSGSMDDETNVTFVKRVWVPSAKSLMGMNDYQPVYTPAGTVAEGPIEKILREPPRGINLNGLPPQGLEEANNAPSPLKFSEVTSSQTVGLRGVTETGSRPGNALPPLGATPTPSIGGKDVFTDVVVNLDGNAHFGGFSKDGFNFPNLAVLVEAARGNLDDPVSFAGAGLVGDPRFAGIVPRFGYQHAYEGYAQLKLEPLNTSRMATLNFSYNLLHTNTCRLGEVSFHDNVGAPGISTFSAPKVSAAYPPGGIGMYLLPNMYEQPINDTLFAIYKMMCTSSTDPAARNWGATNNAGAAIIAATGWLTNPTYHRPNADRAIVLFTNSAPANSEMASTRAAAKRAGDIGIPIYVVGLADNAATQAIQMAAFSDSSTNPSSGGICGIAGHGSRFFQVSNVNEIPMAFGNVGRHLVKLTTSN